WIRLRGANPFDGPDFSRASRSARVLGICFFTSSISFSNFLGGVDAQILTDRPRIRLWSVLNYRVRGGVLRPVDADRRDTGHQRPEAPLRPLRRCQQFLPPRSDPGARSKGDSGGTAAVGAPLTDCPDAQHSKGPSVPSPPLLNQPHAFHLN